MSEYESRVYALLQRSPSGLTRYQIAAGAVLNAHQTGRVLGSLSLQGLVAPTRIKGSRPPLWATSENITAVKAAEDAAIREHNLAKKRHHFKDWAERQKIAAEMEVDDDAGGAFVHTIRPSGTWEHQTTGVLAPATWLCPAMG